MEGSGRPFELTVPVTLHPALASLRGSEGEVWLTVAPVHQPMVEVRGLLGRRKREAARWCIAVQDWSRSGAPTELTLWLQLPPGPRLTQRDVSLPPGAVAEVDDSTDALVRLPHGTEPEVAAVEVCRLAAELIAPHAPGGFFWRVADTATPQYDPSVRSVGG